MRLTVASGGAQTEVSNINTRMHNFSEHSSAGANVWYKAAPVNLIAEHSKIELLSEVKFTVKDFNLTKLSYLKILKISTCGTSMVRSFCIRMRFSVTF